MGCPTKIQVIQRKESHQYYVNFPAQIAQAIDIEKAEEVEWHIHDRNTLVLTRVHLSSSPIEEKKTPPS